MINAVNDKTFKLRLTGEFGTNNGVIFSCVNVIIGILYFCLFDDIFFFLLYNFVLMYSYYSINVLYFTGNKAIVVSIRLVFETLSLLICCTFIIVFLFGIGNFGNVFICTIVLLLQIIIFGFVWFYVILIVEATRFEHTECLQC